MVIGSPVGEPALRPSFKSIQLMVMSLAVRRTISSFSVTPVIKRQCYEGQFKSHGRAAHLRHPS